MEFSFHKIPVAWVTPFSFASPCWAEDLHKNERCEPISGSPEQCCPCWEVIAQDQRKVRAGRHTSFLGALCLPSSTLSPGRKTASHQTLLFLPGCLTLIVPFWPEASTEELRVFLSPQKPCSSSSAAQPSFLPTLLILQANKSHLPSKHILLRGPPHPGALSPQSSLDDCIDTWLLLFWLRENSTAWSLPSARTCGLILPVELPMLPHKWKMFELMISHCKLCVTPSAQSRFKIVVKTRDNCDFQSCAFSLSKKVLHFQAELIKISSHFQISNYASRLWFTFDFGGFLI